MHISVISELYKVSPAKWLAHLQALDEAKSVMVSLYAPLRLAIIAELNTRGAGKKALEKYLEVRGGSKLMRSVATTSRHAFARFVEDALPQIKALDADFLVPSYRPLNVMWEGFELQGKFHFSYVDVDRKVRFAYVNAAAWGDEKKTAFIELLTIIGEKRYSIKREQVVLIDLVGDQTFRVPKKTHSRIREELKKTLELMSVVQNLSRYSVDEEER